MELASKYQHFGYVIATNRVAKERNKVRFMHREASDNDQDSGWRFFDGTEDQAYTDKPENMAIYAVTKILAIDPSIEKYLDTSHPCCFEREDENADFVRNENF